MKVAVAGIPHAWSSERLAAALREAGAHAFVFAAGRILHDLVSGAVVVDGEDLGACDAVVVKKLADPVDAASRLRLHPLRALEARGVRIFSPPDAIDRAMDRYRMTMLLVAAGLPVPATFAAEADGGLPGAIAALGDAVVKPVYTSKGRAMLRVTAGAEAPLAALPAAGPRIVQRFVKAPGRDIGAAVVGGRFLGAFARVAQPGAWMTTTAASWRGRCPSFGGAASGSPWRWTPKGPAPRASRPWAAPLRSASSARRACW